MSRSKAVGTAAESAVVKAALARGIPARRVALAGNQDEGDIHLFNGRLVVECKAGQQTAKPSWKQIADWMAETETEAGRVLACDLAVLVTKRHGSGKADDWVAWTDAGDWYAVTHNMPPHPAHHGVYISLRLGDLFDALQAAWSL